MLNYNLNEAKDMFGCDYIKYLNVHPKKKLVGDCVKRALALAADMPYNDVKNELNRMKKQTHCEEFNEKKNWQPYLEKVLKAEYIKMPIVKAGDRRVYMEDFVKMYPSGSYFVQFARHVVACVDGCFYDTWNSSDKCIYCAWRMNAV